VAGADLLGLQESQGQQCGWEAGRSIEYFSNFFAEHHVCKFCTQSSMQWLLRFLGKKSTLCNNMLELRERAESCKLYKMILSSIEQYNYPELNRIDVFAESLSLFIKADPTQTQPTSMARIFVSLGM